MGKIELEKYENKISFGTWVKWCSIGITAIYFPEWINRNINRISDPNPITNSYNFQEYIGTLVYDILIPMTCSSLYYIGSSIKNKGLIGRIKEELKEKSKPRNNWV